LRIHALQQFSETFSEEPFVGPALFQINALTATVLTLGSRAVFGCSESHLRDVIFLDGQPLKFSPIAGLRGFGSLSLSYLTPRKSVVRQSANTQGTAQDETMDDTIIEGALYEARKKVYPQSIDGRFRRITNQSLI
jgi:hypothetical protein